MPKQEFEFIDYLGPLAVSVCFVIVLFILSLIINFVWITKNDDRTVFEKVSFLVIFMFVSVLLLLTYLSNSKLVISLHDIVFRNNHIELM